MTVKQRQGAENPTKIIPHWQETGLRFWSRGKNVMITQICRPRCRHQSRIPTSEMNPAEMWLIEFSSSGELKFYWRTKNVLNSTTNFCLNSGKLILSLV